MDMPVRDKRHIKMKIIGILLLLPRLDSAGKYFESFIIGSGR